MKTYRKISMFLVQYCYILLLTQEKEKIEKHKIDKYILTKPKGF